jgi:hypothetical protein
MMSEIDGGIVKRTLPFPSPDKVKRFALLGTWSGGTWHRGQRSLPIQVFKDGQKSINALWDIVGVENSSMARDAILIVKPRNESADNIASGDIIIFGLEPVTYTSVSIENTDLPHSLASDFAIEIGHKRLHAVALWGNNRVDKLVIFHSKNDILPRSVTQSVRWRGGKYSIVFSNAWTSLDDASLELYFVDQRIPAYRLLKILNPVRAFTLDVGQEMQGMPRPVKQGQKRPKYILDTFEPYISAATGSLKLFVHPAMPAQIPLSAHPEEPLQLLFEVISAASMRETERIRSVLRKHVISVDEILVHVKNIATTAKKYGAFSIRSAKDAQREVTVDEAMINAVVAAIRTLRDVPVSITGTLYAHDALHYWCRIRSEIDGGAQDWMIRYNPELKGKVSGVIPRNVTVDLLAKVPLGEEEKIYTPNVQLKADLVNLAEVPQPLLPGTPEGV